MKCAQHVALDAVATCGKCGRGLCADCVGVFAVPMCGTCATSHNKGVTKSLWLQLTLMVVLFVGAFLLFIGQTSFGQALWFALIAGFFPSGWQFMGRYFSPSGGYFSPLMRWINLAVQVFAAGFLGVVVGPIFLFRTWREFRNVRSARDALARHEDTA
ncbi:hypothetical protein GCM10025771_10220 [Niveibacterium umoris]|uniref:Uncharacterized protein n=1 Tax=Niveibacterium umoris TaxID=1193620 RepID=A0A840BPH4_9RHOO|nr:hypothetical protein [Niveibacterium umoris]MBB4013428.1 hypothetical protein [Niveibacterium umoris]